MSAVTERGTDSDSYHEGDRVLSAPWSQGCAHCLGLSPAGAR